jgi:UPF0755 protein
MRTLLSIFIIICVIGACYILNELTNAPVQEGNVTLIIKPGTSSYEIAQQLSQNHVIQYPWKFLIVYWLTYPKRPLIAGEYLFTKNSECQTVLDKLQNGRIVIRKITIPEGWTVAQIVSAVQQIDCLEGEIKILPPEGGLLPETYRYTYGEQRQAVIDRMIKAMVQQLEELWLQRQSDDSIIKTPEMALILASIVEKETGIDKERARVASVFINRLRLGMPLQSDPTVIYALTLGKEILDRPLNRQDLAVTSIYNTYKIIGLPPHPIACPGKEALRAVLNPLKTNDLYFVANGTGGHSFSEDLDEHNRHVSKWRKINRLMQKK